MRLGILNLLLARFDIPFAPRGDDGHIGSKRFYSKLKAHLVVALTCTSVADSIRALRLCYLNYALCYYGACKRCSEHIFLIKSARLYGGDNILVNKLVRQILYIKL